MARVTDGKTQPASSSGKIIFPVRLQDDFSPEHSRARIRIRPPSPRLPASVEADLKHDPPTKSIVRRRTQSLPSQTDKKKERRRVQVRFVDALGLELEQVKVFKAQENPSIPQHVLFKLLMNSELSFGNCTELNLPYFKPCFPENLGTQPGFQDRLHSLNVSLEKVWCSEHGITGTIRVLNLAYEKKVYVHHSFTNWRTHMDTEACWAYSMPGGDVDVFKFHLTVPPFILQPGTILEFAICYRVNKSDHWDNNNGNNYTLSCYSYKVTVPKECEKSLLHFT